MSLIKLAVTNPMQMAVSRTLEGLQKVHYDKLTGAAAAVKKGIPGAVEKMRKASSALKSGGVQRLDDAKKATMAAGINKEPKLANIVPFKKPSDISNLKYK